MKLLPTARETACPLSRSLGRWLSLLVLLCSVTCAPAAMSRSLTPNDPSTPYSVLVLEDPEGRMSPLELSQEPDSAFSALDDMPLRKGFTSTTVWLRVLVRNQENDNLIRWLELSSPLLEEIHLFHSHASGWVDTQSKVHLRKPAYRLDIPANSSVRYLIKIKTRTSMSAQVRLWTPEDYLQYETRITMGWSLMYGAYLTVLIFYFLFWIWSREKMHLYYSGYIAINFLAAFTTEGWPLPLLPESHKGTYIDFLGLLISLVIFVGTAFTLEYLKSYLHLRKISRVIIITSALISTICALMVLQGHYSYAAIFSQISSIGLIISTTSMAIYLSFKKQRSAYFFLIAFAPFYMGVIWKYLRNLNVIEPGFWNDNAYQFGAFFHMALMSIGIFASYNRLRHERNQAQALAQAEQSLRKQQNDFMSMLSHETRTPLSVILASAENIFLASDLETKIQGRLQKIVNAAKRIQDLLTSFIERERHLDAQGNFTPQQANFSVLASMQAKEVAALHDVSIEVDVNDNNLIFSFDTYLIKIAIANLLENAIFYSNQSSPIQLKISRDANMAHIMVSDRGPGIPEHDLPHILSRYYRGSNSKGYGLGLYLVDQIAKKHGGRLTIQNRMGTGCSVRLSLPTEHATLDRRL